MTPTSPFAQQATPSPIGQPARSLAAGPVLIPSPMGPAAPFRKVPFWSNKIIDRAAELFGISREDMLSGSRLYIHAHPRFLCAKAMRELGMSYAEIGRRLSRTDHSTIINACEKADIYIERRPYMRMAYEEIFNAAVPGFYPEGDA